MARKCLLFLVLPVLVLVVARLAVHSSAFLRMQIAVQLLGWGGVAEIAKEAIATRWLGTKATASRTAFIGVLDALAEADSKYLSPTGRAVVDPDDIAEGHKYLTHLLRTGLEMYVETDAARPAFRELVAPDRKILGDNPDAKYYYANVDNSTSYLVRGRVTKETYLSFTVYQAPCQGCFFRDTVADLNHYQLKLSADRSFEIFVSTTPPPQNFAGDHLSLADAPVGSSLQLVTRHYYETEISVAVDPHAEPVVLSISLADDMTAAPKLSLPSTVPRDVDMARRLEAVKMFVKKHSTELEQDPTVAPKWFSFEPNVFGPPEVFRDENTGGVGAVDIAYSAAPFKLAADEALVIEGTMPNCVFANIVLWNRYLQTFDYADHKTSLNRRQMQIGRDGSFTLVLAHDDHGRPNWLTTMGRGGGTAFFRFLLPEGRVQRPSARVVKLAELIGKDSQS